LNQIDQVSTRILKKDCCYRAPLGWRAAKIDAQFFEALEIGGDVFREESGGGHSGLKASFLIDARGWETDGFQTNSTPATPSGEATVSHRNDPIVMSVCFWKPKTVV
jgi:hypothetical protein